MSELIVVKQIPKGSVAVVERINECPHELLVIVDGETIRCRTCRVEWN